MTDGVNFRDLTAKLFVVIEQVMVDTIACENMFDVLGIRDEF